MKTASMLLVSLLSLGSGLAPAAVQPSEAAPVQLPPPPPQQPPTPPAQTYQQAPQQQPYAPQAQVQVQDPGGQWVYTTQYGWIWMPYGNQYTYEGTATDTQPYAYAYYPSYGWTWLAAPWVWGWGAYPYFGVLGPSHYGWYRGLYQSGYGWGHYR